MSEIAYLYDKEKNPRGAFIPGVPLRDLTAAEFAGLSDAHKDSVKRQAFYRPVRKKPKSAVPPGDKKESGAS